MELGVIMGAHGIESGRNIVLAYHAPSPETVAAAEAVLSRSLGVFFLPPIGRGSLRQGVELVQLGLEQFPVRQPSLVLRHQRRG
jgi:hypothetical protein